MRNQARVGVAMGVMGVMGVMAGVASGQPETARPTPTPATAEAPTPADPGVLGGPRIEAPAKPATLVERDFGGSMKTLETSPEEAALGLLALSDEERAATRTVLDERAALLDAVVGGNLGVLLRLQGIKDGAATPDQRAAMVELAGKLGGLRARGRLVDELAGVLGGENAAALRRIVEEHRVQAVKDGLEAARKAGGPKTRGQIGAKLTLDALGSEIRRSYDRRAAQGGDQLDAAIAAVEATPEQEGRLRAIALASFEKSLGKPTPAQRREVFTKLMKELDARQKMLLLKHLYGG